MRSTSRDVLLSAEGGGFFAPNLGFIEWASNAVQAAIACDGEVVGIGGGDFGFYILQSFADFIQFLAYPAAKAQYERMNKVIEAMGLTKKDLQKAKNEGKRILALGITGKYGKAIQEGDNPKGNYWQALQTFFHEVEAHLINDLENIEMSDVEEHLVYFGLTPEEREADEDSQTLYSEYEDKLKRGRSIPKKKVLPNSKTGEVRKSALSAIKEYYNNEKKED